ncbi:MAG: enoyl-CoA hydratase [Alphaproteobacteria bacterium]|nr:MAG: enoyl-CoA hydratase [Alphaproteobacteria bacterium]
MGYETVTFERKGSVAVITLDRPDAANTLNMAMGRELLELAIECDENPDIRAVVLTGAGRFFCAGGDIAAFAKEGDNLGRFVKELTTYVHSALSRFARMDAPLITAINGTAAGGGISMAACGDIAIAAEEAKFTMAYTRAALVPDASSTYFITRHIGLRRMQELAITNRLLTAAEALDWGLVTRVVPGDRLMEEAMKLAAELANGPTKSFGYVKSLLLETFSNGLETQLEREARAISAAGSSEDGREGIAAFLEKRPPEFKGR